MKLVPGVYFWQKGDMVYLRNVNDRRDHLYNPIVWDILSCIRQTDGCDEEYLLQYLSGLYEIGNPDSFREAVTEFLRELEADRILEAPAVSEVSVRIPAQVEALSLENGQLCSAALELTYRCSERCIHCYVDDCPAASQPELTLEEYKDILRQLKDLGCTRLLLTGGEVCLRKDFIGIARHAVSLGLLVDVYTNGISMTDQQFDALCDMKVNSVSFSLYSGEAAVHDAITKVPGSFEKTLKRLMMFKCAGVDTFIKTVVIRQNLDSLESLYQLGKRIGVDVTAATAISDTHTGCSAQPYRLDSHEQRLKALRLMRRYEPRSNPSRQRDPDAHVCKAGVTAISIDPYGGVHPCVAFTASAGSVREASIKTIWKAAPLMRKVRSFRSPQLSKACGSCQYADHCAVCLGASYDASQDTFSPGADTCQWSKAKHDANALASS